MENKNIVEEIEEICINLRKNKKDGMELMKQFIPKLQIMLPQFMEKGEERNIPLEKWLEVLNDIMTAMKRTDMVLLIDALEYGLKELIEKTVE